MVTDERGTKQQRPSKPDVKDLLVIAREMWQKDPNKPRSAQSEDRDSQETFGCGASTALNAWGMLFALDLLPPNASLCHLLWTLHFLKAYGKTRAMCSACGGIDPKTFRKWVWLFIEALSMLEPFVVRR